MPDSNFWNGKVVLVTGHTGFKGSWLTIWLNKMGAKVIGVGLAPVANPHSLFKDAQVASLCQSNEIDITDRKLFFNFFESIAPEIVFHLAAQTIVNVGYSDPLLTYDTNFQGTLNVLECLRVSKSVKSAVFITTDKVYKNHEWVWPYRETDELGGYDPYSASKAASEILISSYRSALLPASIGVAVGRAGNVIGGGDWCQDGLIPDLVRSYIDKKNVYIRNPGAVRPWQHVLDPLNAYMLLAQRNWGGVDGLNSEFNFGPNMNEDKNVRALVGDVQNYFEGNLLVSFGDGTKGYHEARLLTLDISKSINVLGHRNLLAYDQAIKLTFDWYRDYLKGENAYKLCLSNINQYGN